MKQPAEKPGEKTKESRFKALAKELLQSLVSPDRPTRKAGKLFFLSLIGMVLVIGLGIARYIELNRESEEHRRMVELEKKRLAELADWHSNLEKQKQRTVDLGRFLIELRPDHRDADFDLAALCSDQNVREYVDTRSVQAKNEITSALLGAKAEHFLSPSGKAMLRRKILDHLNSWLNREYPGAHIDEIYFTNILVN